MLTGELRGKVDALWNAFWAGGIANPIEVIEQVTYLLFIRRLDELHIAGRGEGGWPRQADGAAHFPGRARTSAASPMSRCAGRSSSI